MDMLTKQEVKAFLDKQALLYLSVASPEGDPFGAVLLFTVDDDLSFRFVTHAMSRKAQLLMDNPKAAAVIGDDKPMSVQLTGTVERMTKEEQTNVYSDLLEKADKLPDFHPPIFRVSKDVDYIGFVLKPDWLRALDLRNPKISSHDSAFTVLIGADS